MPLKPAELPVTRRPSNQTAVVVSADPARSGMLAGFLEQAGIGARGFDCAEAALGAMESTHPPDLMVADLHMPGIDGYRFCRLLRSPEYAAFNRVPILMVSDASVWEQGERWALDSGADDFQLLPVEAADFSAKVLSLLGGEGLARRPQALVASGCRDLAGSLAKSLAARGYRAETASTLREADSACSRARFELAVIDRQLPDGNGESLLDAFRVRQPDCVCLMMSESASPESALAWMKQGAAAFLRKPFDPDLPAELCTRAQRERSLLRARDHFEAQTRLLRESGEKYRVLFHSCPLGITVSDSSGKIVESNAEAETLLGVSKDEQAQRRIDGEQWRVIRPDGSPMPPEEFASVRALKEGRRVEDVEMGIVKPSGEVTWINVSATPLALEGCGVVITYGDISARKQAEEALRRRVRFERCATDCIRILAGLEDPDQMLPRILSTLRTAAAADRAYVFRHVESSDGEPFMSQLYESCAEGVEAQIGNPELQRLFYSVGAPTLLPVLLKRQPYKGTVAAMDLPEREILQAQGIVSILILPIFQNHVLWGFIGLDDCRTPREWQDEEIQILSTVTDVVGVALERHRKEEALEASNRRLAFFLEVSRRIVSTLERDELMQTIVESATESIGLDSGAVYLLQEDGRIHLAGTMPALPAEFPGHLRKASLSDHPHIARAIASGECVVLPDALNSRLTPAERAVIELRRLRSNLYLPILVRGRSLGVLILSSTGEPHDFTAEEISLLQGFASQAAQIIDNVGNYERLKDHEKELEQEVRDRRRAEEQLRESENRLQSIWLTAPIGIGVVRNRILREANPQLCGIVGYTLEELIGQSARMLYPTDEEFGYVGREKYRQIREQGTGTVETRWRRKDGEIVDVLLSSTPINTNDLSEGVTFTALDITERKRAEAEREKLQAQLTQAQKMESVGRLAGGVAHDFNNMLAVIQGHTEMALDGVGPADPLRADLEEVRKAAQRSADLTRQLLAFARKQTVAPKLLDLNATIDSMLRMLRRLIGEDIDLVWLPGRGLWQVVIDPAQIDQILANLCVNSRDAIAGVGRISIETANASFDEAFCTRHAEFSPGDFVTVSVSDDGCGMDSETISHLFEPFFTTKEVGKGTGLGLATVYGAVKQNRGFVNVYSEPGRGTTVRIYLPRHVGKSEVPNTELRAQTMSGRETVLLVEDEPMILQMTAKMLEALGYSVLAARTPGEAIRIAREHAGRIELLLTDVVMPEMNGRDLARNLLSVYPDIRLLFMSGYTANVIAHQGVLDPGVHFIQKPFSKKDLASKIREAIGAAPG